MVIMQLGHHNRDFLTGVWTLVTMVTHDYDSTAVAAVCFA